MRGLGPYVINTITPSGAVRLETLDGEQMANFINGSRLKKYEEPLTEDMLQRMHQARTRKEAQALLKQQAQEEARARVVKAKERRKASIFTIKVMDEEEQDYIEPFHIHVHVDVENTTYEVSALIDSGADNNVLSYAAWETLGRPSLVRLPVDLQSFSGEETSIVGKCTITMSIQGHLMQNSFYVAPKSQAMVDMVLGRFWNVKTNCSLDWVNRQYTLQLCNSGTLIGKCVPVYPSLRDTKAIDIQSTTLLPPLKSEEQMH